MHQLGTKGLRTARALASKDWQKPADLIHARHMAHEGATVLEIAEALGWNVKEDGACYRLKKFNIVARRGRQQPRAHLGAVTSLPPGSQGFSTANYRPKQVGAAQ